MTKEWRASVTAVDIDALLDEQFEVLLQSLRAVIRHEAERQQLHMVWRLQAPCLAEATETALSTVTESLRTALGSYPQLIDLRVVESEQADAERDHPNELELMGYTEAAAELGVSRQRVAQLDGSNPDFPRPIGRIGAGPVFTADSIRSFAQRWDRSPGRRKAA
jgi:hypothetical protein